MWFVWMQLTVGYFRRLLSLSETTRKLDGLDGEGFVAVVRTHKDGRLGSTKGCRRWRGRVLSWLRKRSEKVQRP